MIPNCLKWFEMVQSDLIYTNQGLWMFGSHTTISKTTQNFPNFVQNLEICMRQQKNMDFNFFFNFDSMFHTHFMIFVKMFALFLVQNFKTKFFTGLKNLLLECLATHMVQRGPKWSEIVQHCPKLSKIVQSGQKGSKVVKRVQSSPKLSQTIQNSSSGPKCSNIAQNGPKWSWNFERMCLMSRIKCYVSDVRCQGSGVTCEVSSVKFFFYKIIELVLGGSFINGPTPSSFRIYGTRFQWPLGIFLRKNRKCLFKRQ